MPAKLPPHRLRSYIRRKGPYGIRRQIITSPRHDPLKQQLVATLLPAGSSFPTQAVTGLASTDVLTAATSGYTNGNVVRFLALTGGAPLQVHQLYHVRDASGLTFKVAESAGGAAVNLTSDLTAGTVQRLG